MNTQLLTTGFLLTKI